MPNRPASAAPVLVTLLAAVLVVVGVLAAALVGPLSLQAEPAGPLPMATIAEPSVTQSPAPTPEELPLDAPPAAEWAAWIARAVQVLAAAVAGVLLFWLLRRATRGWRLDLGSQDDDAPPGDGESTELSDTAVAALREGVAAATRALDEDVPPGDAVIGAWVAVETAAARTGVERDRAQTASEFTVDVLGATRADPAATRDLLALYLAARFGSHPVTVDDVRAARDLLAVVARGLVARDDAPVGEPSGEPAP